MERALKSIRLMETCEDSHIKEALFRDAVISYVKPFSGNRGQHQKKGLRLSQKGIPGELKAFHLELEQVRNKLFAHNDVEEQRPTFGPGVSFSVKGYERVFCEHLVQPLQRLAQVVHGKLMNEMQELESECL